MSKELEEIFTKLETFEINNGPLWDQTRDFIIFNFDIAKANVKEEIIRNLNLQYTGLCELRDMYHK